MNSKISFFLILLLINIFNIVKPSSTKRKSFKEILDQYLSNLEINNNAYLSYNQYISLLNTLVKDFPNYLELSSIGKTYEGNEMPLIIMKSPFIYKEENSTQINNTQIEEPLYNKSGILFTGMHHGREPVSMMMNIYLILHLLSLPKIYLHLFLSTTNIYFIPIINIDTYKYNCAKYLSGISIRNVMARKNRKPHFSKKCNSDDIGIDLNRNYDYFFAKDNEGSSGNPCQEDYRGERPFSEPETINIKNFVDSHPDIKIVYNYHSWGNLIITPFNYLKKAESLKIMEKEFPIQYKMYQDFKKEAQFPQNFLFGNADDTIKYLTNGDATDWFLGKKKILSFSPELGNGNKNSDVFYPNREITFDVLEKNLYGGLYAIQKSMYYFYGELLSATYNECSNKNRINIINEIYMNKAGYFKNTKDYGINNCYSDEYLLNVKIKLTNRGFGDYEPGLVIPFFQQINIYNNETTKTDNKKYYYFFALDLNIDLDKVKSICYWNTLQTLYTIETDGNDKEQNNTKKEAEETQYIGKIRCSAINKKNDINDIKLFIDNEIKSMEFIILNIQLVVKKDKFLEKIQQKSHRFLNMNINNNTNNKNKGNNEIIKLYTKNERVIKSEKANGEIIKWKFNDPIIGINIDDFIEQKSFTKNKNKTSIYKLIIISICITLLITVLICRMIKSINGRHFRESLVDYSNNALRISENNNNNFDINMGMNEQIVNNLENANQQENVNNNDQVIPVQIPREENESHSNNNNANSNSNANSPDELNN